MTKKYKPNKVDERVPRFSAYSPKAEAFLDLKGMKINQETGLFELTEESENSVANAYPRQQGLSRLHLNNQSDIVDILKDDSLVYFSRNRINSRLIH